MLTNINRRLASGSKASIQDGSSKEDDLEQVLAGFIDRTKRGAMIKELRSFMKQRSDSFCFLKLLADPSDLTMKRIPDWSAWKEPGAFERCGTLYNYGLF